MQLVPISRYPSPAYPTEEAVQSEPSFLRVVPRRWKGNRAVLTALAAALALTQGCTSKPVARLAGTPAAPDLKTEKEIRAPRHAGPKATATPSPTPQPQPAIPQTFPAIILGDPAPPTFTTEADVTPKPSPAPALSGTDGARIMGKIAVPRLSTEDDAKSLQAPSAQPSPSVKPLPKP